MVVFQQNEMYAAHSMQIIKAQLPTQGSSAALVIAIAYIIQAQSAAWYVKFTKRMLYRTAIPASG